MSSRVYFIIIFAIEPIKNRLWCVGGGAENGGKPPLYHVVYPVVAEHRDAHLLVPNYTICARCVSVCRRKAVNGRVFFRNCLANLYSAL